MNRTDKGTTNRVSGAIGKAGADFKREFTPDTYRQFFADAGYPDAEYTLCEGRIPCAVAVLQKKGGTGMKVTTLDERVIQDIGYAFGYYDYGPEHGLIRYPRT